jgi:hypothetical protein
MLFTIPLHSQKAYLDSRYKEETFQQTIGKRSDFSSNAYGIR